MTGLLAVHAHPDDETLGNGALLATWAAAGRPVTVATCTRGEQGEVIPPELAALAGDGAALARHRAGELAAALGALGVEEHVFLDELDGGDRWTDSGMAWAGVGRARAAERLPEGAFVRVPVDRAAQVLAGVVRARRPDVVVGYEPGGGYGHPDHVHAHRVMMRAVELAAQARPLPGGERPHRVPAVLWTVAGEGELRVAHGAIAEAAAAAGLAAPDPAGPLPSLAVPDDRIDLRAAVGPVLPRVLAALRAHATQVQAVGVPDRSEVAACYALSNGILQPVLHHESYRWAAGWPPKAVPWPDGVLPRVA